MKTVDKLSSKDRLLLAALYETDTYKALKKLINEGRLSIAKNCLTVPQTYEQLKYLQGQAYSLKQLHEIIRDIYKEQQANEKKKLLKN